MAAAAATAIPETSNGHRKPRIKTYRIRSVNSKFTRLSLSTAIAKLFNLENRDFTLHSISYDINPASPERTKSATVSFKNTPNAFNDERTQWSFDIPLIDSKTIPTNEIVFDTRFDDFTPLTPEENEDTTEIDCIFIHGWGGHPVGSFAAPTETYFWPRDSLPQLFPTLRVLLYGYNSSLTDPDATTSVYDYADTFRRALRFVRRGSKARSHIRPLIFIVHSLGGWVFQHAIIDMASSDDPDETTLIQSTVGALYFGVPGQGMRTEEIISLIQDLPSRYTANLLDEQLGFRLRAKHEEQFRRAFKDKPPMIYLFYEEQKTPTIRRDEKTQKWVRDGPLALSVNPTSATYGALGNEFKISLDRHHNNMVKFGRFDSQFNRVLQPLEKLVDRAETIIHSRQDKETDKGTRHRHSELNGEEQDLLQSLAYEKMNIRQHDITEPAEGTCMWLINHSKYQVWSTAERGLLWINGNPGSGKSTLMAHGLELHRSCASFDEIILSFFFHGRGSDLEKNLAGLYRSLLHQLLQLYRVPLANLALTYSDRTRYRGRHGKDWHWSEQELRQILKSQVIAAALTEPVTIFIDALDEAGEANAKILIVFIRDLYKQATTDGARLKICFSCRHYPLMQVGNVSQICLENENSTDISLYISTRLSDLQDLDTTGLNMEPLRIALLNKAAGSFQWAKIILDQIADQHRNEESFISMTRTIHSNPGDLTALYRTLLASINEKDRPYSLRLFQWICFAIKPLDLDEIRMALVLELDHTSFDQCRQSEYYVRSNIAMQRRLRFLSAGLAETFVYNEQLTSHGGSSWMWLSLNLETSRIQLVHQSVLDFLLEEGLQMLHTEHLPANSLSIQSLMLQSCFCCLGMENSSKQSSDYSETAFGDDFLDVYGRNPQDYYKDLIIYHGRTPPDREEFLSMLKRKLTRGLDQRRHRPLYDYATQNWTTHLQIICEAAADVEHLRPILYGPGRTLQAHIETNGNHWWNGVNMLHVAARCDIVELLRFGISEKIDPNIQDTTGKTALLLACERSYVRIASLLLELEQIDVNLPDRFGTVPIHANNYRDDSTVKILELLFSHPRTDINAKIHLGQTILMFGYLFSTTQAFRVLLDRADLDVNVATTRTGTSDVRSMPALSFYTTHQDGNTALHCAVLKNSAETVKLLLQRPDLDVNAQDGTGDTAMSIACYNGNKEIVEALLRHSDIDADTLTQEGFTPLMFACYSHDNNLTVPILLDYGLNADMQDNEGRTALWYAASKGFGRTVERLINHGANLSVKALDGSMALANAFLSAHNSDIVSLLIVRGGVDAVFSTERDALNAEGEGLIHYTAQAKRIESVSTLLDRGFNPNLQNSNGQAAIHFAVLRGLEDHLRLLLAHGADVNIQDVWGQTPLHHALRESDSACAEILLRHNADVTLCDHEMLTSLNAAIAKGIVSCVNKLLRHSHTSSGFGTSDGPRRAIPSSGYRADCTLCGAIEKLKASAIQRDSFGYTAVHHALMQGKLETLKLLTDTSPDNAIKLLNCEDLAGQPLLIYTVTYDQIDALLYLLSKGVDPNVRDRRTRATALHYAVVANSLSMVRVLLSFEANVNLTDQEGYSPMGILVLKKELKSSQPEIYIGSSNGRYALSGAARDRRAIVQLLLDYGADLEIVDLQGRTPPRIAADGGHHLIAQWMQEYVPRNSLSELQAEQELWKRGEAIYKSVYDVESGFLPIRLHTSEANN